LSIINNKIRTALIAMISNSTSLTKYSIGHIINQKMGNNPVEVIADNNVYTECEISNVHPLIVGGYGTENERGLGASRDIDYASYIVKIMGAIKDVPLLRTNGPFQNTTTELDRFIGIWSKYYKLRSDSYSISINDKPKNPFAVVTANITKDDRNIRLEMIIANCKLVETNRDEMKYFGDLMIFASENLGYGTKYTKLSTYSENAEERTTLSALTGNNPYGRNLLKAVEQSFENIYFVLSELESINPNLSQTKKMLWVSNTFAKKK
jgi:hypothetical protein